MWLAFGAGKDLGYSKGLAAGTTAEYVNGVNDGVQSCLEAVLNSVGGSNKRYILRQEEYSDETL